jgi:hypothetical protein
MLNKSVKDFFTTVYNPTIELQDVVLDELPNHPKLMIWKSRQVGVTTTFQYYIIHKMLTTPNTTIGISFPHYDQNRRFIQSVKLDLKCLIDMTQLCTITKNSTSEILLSNGSKIIGISQNASSTQGIRVDIMIVCGFGMAKNSQLRDFWFCLLPSLSKNSQLIVEYEGIPEHEFAKELWNNGQENGWKQLFIPQLHPLPNDNGYHKEYDPKVIHWENLNIFQKLLILWNCNSMGKNIPKM